MDHQTAEPAASGAPPRGVLVITGTGTGIGKTVVTAAVAALARARGDRVAIVKPAQTGVHPGPGSDVPDAETIERLSGVADTHELARFPDPLSPEAAARVSGLPPLDLAHAAEYIGKLAASRDLVLVEGAGGLLVRYDPAGATLADLAAMCAAPVLVVVAAGLGTLNHTALTLEALTARRLELAGVAIGSWPADPGLAERQNLSDLETLIGGPLAGAIPEGSGELTREAFHAVALRHLAPTLGGARSTGSLDPRISKTLISNEPLLRPALPPIEHAAVTPAGRIPFPDTDDPQVRPRRMTGGSPPGAVVKNARRKVMASPPNAARSRKLKTRKSCRHES